VSVDPPEPGDTRDAEYTRRLAASVAPRHGWRRIIDPQRPYRWHIRHMRLGRVLDIGCGAGRNLSHLRGNGVGVDHNPSSVAIARSLGLTAYATEEFEQSADAVAGSYDALLFAHVLEHMTSPEAATLIEHYLPYIAAEGCVVAICPQQRGQRSDATHVTYMPRAVIASVFADAGLELQRAKSFPFPEVVGRVFTHNETVAVGRRIPAPV
jgi:2-polyprenyl-3-methyl-5-hydroxy-6-metoxy-1,4-benzoquinol methylase